MSGTEQKPITHNEFLREAAAAARLAALDRLAQQLKPPVRRRS